MKKQAIGFLGIDHYNTGNRKNKCPGAGIYPGVYGTTRKPFYKQAEK